MQFENGRLKRRIVSMEPGSQPVEIERKKSYGIGGAGNIRMFFLSFISSLLFVSVGFGIDEMNIRKTVRGYLSCEDES